MADNFSSQDRTGHSPYSNLAVKSVVGAIFGGGFLLGIVFGQSYLPGRADERADERAERSSRREFAARQAAHSSEPGTRGWNVDLDSVSNELAVQLRREIEALRNELLILMSLPVSVESASEIPEHSSSNEVSPKHP